MDLGNGLEWLKIYDQFHVAQPNPIKSGKFYPIPYILIPTYLDNYTVAILLNPTISKPSWKLGGRIYTFIEVNNSDLVSARTNRYYSVPVNIPTILNIKQISTYYRLIVDVPSWFADVYLQAWVYLGQETLDSLEGKVEQIQLDLKRIENKIDINDTYNN